jgi:hypothetical protein
MSIASDFQTLDKTAQLALIAVGVYIAWNVYQWLTNPSGSNGLGNPFIPDPNDTAGNPNSVGDTSQAAYAGNGVLGGLANLMNQALGGIPQSIGNSITLN